MCIAELMLLLEDANARMLFTCCDVLRYAAIRCDTLLV